MKNIQKTSLLVGFSLAALSPAAAREKQPNILFILADDLGWRDLSCTGSEYYESPNIDRIARKGVNFTQGYAACQVSSPSRASIMTGKFTARHGITNWIGEATGENWRRNGRHSKLLPAEYTRQLALEDTTLPEALQQQGYTTFMAGKWHLGGKGSYPEDHGFDINIGGHEAGSPPGGYFSPYQNPKMDDGPRGENLSIRLAAQTASFIEEHTKRNKKQPFFAYLSFYAVHAPLETTETNWRYFRDKAVGNGVAEEGFAVDRTLAVRQQQDNPVYAGLIRQMDDAVGLVLNKLEELGLDKNTIIVFTSDNGGVSSGDAYATSNLPLRGGKGRQWEGGFRVPLLIQYPGCKEPGSTCDVPVTGADFFPTFLDMAGLPLLPEQHVDGVSIRPLLLDGQAIAPRALYWHYPHYGNQGGEPSSVIRDGDWKLIHYYEDNRDELYNLRIDPTESEPLNAQYPDKVDYLGKKLSVWLTDSNARYPVPDPQYDPVRERAYKEKQQTQVKERLERQRKEMLGDRYLPNADWWGSSTID
ncbi:sulfatase [Parabacteroides sp. PF5-6]|uniref:sulfatase n=1 Tax=Parabacteroides sp. PF5-6 TaxID=1742403 RepID=UPI002406BBDC|nr:sulfatase [Parabacteroides sp. PF5-6]MDF9829770.1 arylsulfatase A-like enzyme [Parabacteroides sp. PF5-6]